MVSMGIPRETKDALENPIIVMYKELLIELYKHLQQIGINGTAHPSQNEVDSMTASLTGRVAGYVTLEGRNIEKIQVEIEQRIDQVNTTSRIQHYHYIVPANIQGFEQTVDVKITPIRKRFFSRDVVDFRWEGRDLAQQLNDDVELRTMIAQNGLNPPPRIEVKAHCQPRPLARIGDLPQALRDAQSAFTPCIRITNVHARLPTRETFNIYDRIANHIQGITTVMGSSGRLLGVRSGDQKFEMLPVGVKLDATTRYINTYHHAHKEMKRALRKMERHKARAHARRPLL